MPQNVETGMWFTSFVVLIGVIAMILFIAKIGRRGEARMSRERAEREGLLGEEGLRRARARHNEHG